MVQDRFRFSGAERERVMEALDTALRMGAGHLAVHVMDDEGRDAQVWKYSDRLHCADCDIEYTDPLPSSFSFNSPLGACESLPWLRPRHRHRLRPGDPGRDQDPARRRHQALDHAVLQGMPGRPAEVRAARGVPLGVPWKDMKPEHKHWVLHGTPDWKGGNDAWKHQWYGVQRFDWLETKAYKMHVRVLLSKYRSYTPCPACNGARLKPDALLWRLGTKEADAVLPPDDGRYRRFMPVGASWTREQLDALDGLSVHDVMLLPIERVRLFFDKLSFTGALDAATDLLMTEVRARLKFLCDVGLGYLTLDRQSRTLSGGEVQRIT